MSRWPIHRRWSIIGSEFPQEVTSDQLTQFGGLCLIGAAGLGKTFELEYLVEEERQAGREIRKVRAAELAHSAEALAQGLNRLATTPTAATVIYIDALDEAMVPVRHAGLVVAAWLRDRIRGSGISVRLACRSAVFPDTIRAALFDVYGNSLSIAALQPLTLDDVAIVVEHAGGNPDEFIRLVERSRIESLATQPLTLSMLLQIARSGRPLPPTREALFEQGVRLLATERSERIEDGTAVDVTLVDLLDAAERVSCFTLMAGVELVDYGDMRFDGTLSVHELGGLPGGTRPLDATVLRALRQSGLTERGGPTAFRMAHRQVAEYLAGRRLGACPSNRL